MLLTGPRVARLAFVLALSAVKPAFAANWQNTPDSLHLGAVGDSLRLNGTPMQIRAFKSLMPIDTLLLEVEQSWKRSNRSDVTRTVIPGWTVLNQTVGEEHRSFQVRPSGPGQIEGFVALTSPKLHREPKPVIRLPSDMTAVTIIDSVDAGLSSQQVIAVSPRSLDASANAIEFHLKAAGWERHVYKKHGDSVRFAANKGSQQFDATVSMQKNGSLIMFNVLTK